MRHLSKEEFERYYPALEKEVMTLDEVKERYVLRALVKCGYNRSLAARRLGVSIRCMRNWLQAFERKHKVVLPYNFQMENFMMKAKKALHESESKS